MVGFESTEDVARAGGVESFRAIQANVSFDPPTFVQMGGTRAPAPAISQDGSRIAFAAKDNPLGTNNDGNSEIFLYDGAKLVQVTNTSPGDPSLRVVNGNFLPSISDDGRFIAFSSNRDPAGQNSDGNLEIFIFDTVALSFTQLTNSSGIAGATHAKISGNGSNVAYIRDSGTTATSAKRDLLLQNRVGPPAVRVLATAVQSLALTYGRAISDDGLRVVWSAETAVNTTQVFLFDGRNNNTTRQITGLGSRATDVPLHPTISGNGSRIAFATRRSVAGAGSNSDSSVELYTFDIPSGSLGRVTNVNSSSATAEVLSSMNDDGGVVAFNYPRILSGAVTNSDFANNSEIYITGTPVIPASGSLTTLNRASMGHEPSSINAVAPDSIAVALGSALSFLTEQGQRQPDGTFPLTVAGTTVTVNGRRAQIFFVSPTEVHFHVPAATEIGNAEVVVTNSDGFQSRGIVPTLRSAPGVFTKNGDGLGEGMILNADMLTSGPFDPSGGHLRLIIFSTGVRNGTGVSVTAAGRALTLESIVAATNMPGMDEIHVFVPADLRGAGKVDLVVRADGRDSNSVSIEFSGDARRDILLNEFLADPSDSAAGDANGDGTRDTSQDEFVELVNTTTHDIDISGYQILTRGSGTSDTLRHTFPSGTIVNACSAIVVFGGGNFDSNNAAFGGARVVKASSGSLTLINAAGVITLRDPGGNIANFVAYGGSTGLDSDDDQSLTRAPDITGSFAKHGAASGGARLFSPGTQINGSPFSSCGPDIARVEVSPASATIETGQQQQFTARAFDAGNNEIAGFIFIWQSSNTGVATVDQNGLATGSSPGSTQIRAVGRGLPSAPAVLIVNPPPQILTSLTIFPTNATLSVGETQQFTAQAKDQFGRDMGGVTITFASNNTSVATVDSVSATSPTGSATSSVTARSAGGAQIRGTATNGTTTVTSAPATVVVEPAAGQLLISEFRTRGPAGAGDEFVEIYNPTLSTLSIGGLRIRASNSGGSVSDRVTITAGTMLGPGCHYLVANSSAGGYTGPVPADQTYGTGLTDDGGIAITGSNGITLIDAVGMSNGSAYKEGSTLAPLGSNANQSYERKPGGAAGNGTDTINNSADFLFNAGSSNPQNLSSGCLDLSSADLAIAKTESLDPVFIGSELTYSITVTNNGAGAAQSVVVADNLPAGVTFVSCSSSGEGVCGGTGNNRTVTFGSVLSGSTETITLVAAANGPGGSISNTATVSSTTPDPNPGNNSASTATAIQALPPTLTVSDVSASEGTGGATTFMFTVRLSSPAPANVTFDIATQDNTSSVADNDYNARTLTAQTIPAGEQSYVFSITVNGDIKVEPAETFFVNVTNVSGAVVVDGQGLGTIENDDAANLVISQLYAGGGNSGASFTNDFVEIFNRGNTIVNFANTPYSIQYAGATANFGSNKVDLASGSVLPGQYFLIQLGGGANGSPLAIPDAGGSIVMATTAGKVALVAGTSSLSGSGCPIAATVADFIGYGTIASCFEGSRPAPAPSNTTADFRKAGGCTDSNDNAADFTVHDPAPRNTSAPLNNCSAPPPHLTITDVTSVEGNSGAKIFSFTVNLSAPAQGADVVFDIATQDYTATTANNDYIGHTLTSQMIPVGQQTYQFDVVVNGDSAVEPDENFLVNVTNVSGAVVTDVQAVGTIQNDDPPTLSINDVTLAEGDSGTKVFNFTVSLSEPVAAPVSFDIATQDNTASVVDNDYVANALTAQLIPAGQLTYNFPVIVNGDIKIEANEGFFVNLMNLSGAPVADGQGVGNIQNDDSAALSINDVTRTEGTSGASIFTFTVTSSLPAGPAGVTFNISTQDGTATASSGDYVAKSFTSQTIPAGQNSYTFDVTVNGDLLVELDESFFVNLTSVSNATVMEGQGQGTIQNDDSANLVISQLYAGGGNVGATFTNDFVEIFNRGNTTVNFATTPCSIQYAGATANFGSNKVDLSSGTVLPGQYFLVQLAGGTSGSPLPRPDATGSIVMAATAGKVALVVGISALPVSTCPGDNGEAPFNPNHLAIADFVGYGPSANCYEGEHGPTVAPGNTTSIFRVAGGCIDSNVNAADFFTHAPVPRNTSSPLNNCAPGPVPALSINDVTATESNGFKTFTFTISLSAATTTDVRFEIATHEDTATVANNDYVARTLTNGIIPAGVLTTTFDVGVNGDTAAELDETFFVNVANVQGATVADSQGLGTILNDDTPTISINNVSLAEGDSGTTVFNFTVSLSGPTRDGVVFDIFTRDGTAIAADNDYIPRSLSGQPIQPGEQSFIFSVTVNGDLKIEANETFEVLVTNIQGALPRETQSVGTILNDDTPTLSINDVAVNEGDIGASLASFTVTSSLPAPPGGITFNITTQDATATAASGDYVAKSLSGQTIPEGMTTYTFDVTVNGDTIVEPNETFLVKVTPVSGATVSDDTGQGAIQNDDASLVVVSQLYGGGGNAGSVFKNDFIEIFNRGNTTVNLAGWSVQYSSATGSTWSVTPLCPSGACMLSPGQYFLVEEDQGTGGTTDLPAPDAAGSIAMTAGAGKVAVVSSTTALSGTCPSSANILDLVGYGGTASCFEGAPAPAPSNTLADVRKGGGCVDTANNSADFFTHAASPRNSAYPVNTCAGQTVDLSINDVTVTETDTGTISATFTVTLHGSTGSTVTVDYSTSDGAAVAPSDYQAITTTQLVFNPGDVTKTITVNVNGDTLDEPSETFFVNLFNATNAGILDNQGQGMINDNDVPPALTINDVSQSETNGATTFTFTVHLSAPALTGRVTFDIATADGTAQDDTPPSEDNDYVAQAITGVTIPAGSQDYMFSVTVNGDTVNEANETFFVNVTNVSGATVGDGQGLGTIQNDDSPTLNINDVSQAEGNTGTSLFNFTVTSTLPAPAGGISFQVSTADVTAQDDNPVSEDNDYVPQVGTVYVIPEGLTSVTVPITVNGDSLVELNETFTVNVSNVTGASAGDSQGVGTIQNDDTPNLVISQIYPGGNNTGATYRNDFIELFNRGTTTVNFAITPYSVQYAGAGAAFATAKTDLTSGTIAPGQYFLIQQAGGSTNGAVLPTPDATGMIAMAATGGKVALVLGTTLLPTVTCPGDDAAPPTNPSGNNIVDFVGYGSGANTPNCSEGPGSAAFSTSTAGGLDPDARSVIRTISCTDTNNNSADFSNPTTAPTARNTATPAAACP